MLVIARRELVERAKSKWFVVMTLLGPIFMVALVMAPHLLGRGAKSKIEIIDRSGELAPALVRVLEAADWNVTIVDHTITDDAVTARIASGAINGVLRIPADALDGGQI